jgi:hypothetical protein
MTSGPILVTNERSIVRVTFNRPEKHNCMNTAMWRELKSLFDGFDADESLRCIVLAGAGGKAFSVGADIAEFPEVRANAAQARDYAKLAHGAMHAIAGCRHPVIAAIEGLCVGGGLELASTCDMRFCTESSRFGVPVKRLGLVVAYAELLPLVRLVGPAECEGITAGRQGVRQRTRTRDGAGQPRPSRSGLRCRHRRDRVRDRGRCALVARWHKKFVDRLGEPAPLTPEELDESYHCFDTEDFRIGTEAFNTKTQPAFKGR